MQYGSSRMRKYSNVEETVDRSSRMRKYSEMLRSYTVDLQYGSSRMRKYSWSYAQSICSMVAVERRIFRNVEELCTVDLQYGSSRMRKYSEMLRSYAQSICSMVAEKC